MLDFTFVGDFFAAYGWYLVLLFILIQFVFPNADGKARQLWNGITSLSSRQRTNTSSQESQRSGGASQATNSNLSEIRAKQQARLNRIAELTQEQSQQQTSSNNISTSQTTNTNTNTKPNPKPKPKPKPSDNNNNNNNNNNNDDDSDKKSKKKKMSKSEKKRKEELFKKSAGKYSSFFVYPCTKEIKILYFLFLLVCVCVCVCVFKCF